MSFNTLDAFTKKVADMADQPSGTPAEIKSGFDAAPEELRQSFNNLVNAIKSTASGDSGAKNVGATAITGLTGTDVQTILESLANRQVTSGTITYFNGFSQFDSTNTPCWVTKDPSGMVSFYLLIYGNGTGTIANNTCAQLPTGFRPAKRMLMSGYVDNGSNAPFLYYINADGGIVFVRNFTTNNVTWLLMTGTFPAGN